MFTVLALTVCSPLDRAEAALFGGSPVVKKRYVPKNRAVFGPEFSLIGENSLEGWTSYNGKTPPDAWSVVDGVLHLKGKGGDILTEKEYENYVLDFTWTIAKGGNSGIKYRFKRFEKGGWLGPEYQVLDDPNTGEGKKPKNNAATLYDIKPTNDQKQLHAHTEQNHGRIVVHGNKLEHWINGKKVVEIRIGSEEWKKLKAESKFNEYEGFGENSLGKIMIQDHGCEVWFHKISMREIIDPKTSSRSRQTIKPCAKVFPHKKMIQKTSRRSVGVSKASAFKPIAYKSRPLKSKRNVSRNICK